MQQPVYEYSQYQIPPSTYPRHPRQQQQMITYQPLTPHQQALYTMLHQSPTQSSGMARGPYPQTQFEPDMQRHMDPTALQRSPTGPISPHRSTPSALSWKTTQASGQRRNPSATPGPIPAKTPLVVRQDNDGVQWIAFEYSRDRVKIEYTIRCDVESVNTDNLPKDFRTDNCVYPKACCDKDSYKGNRFQYENECNTVGWALAKLNPCLRVKRGLIQRAVDSWRNSNQDPKFRSRRVRKEAKINARKVNGSGYPPSGHIAGPVYVGVLPPSTNPMEESMWERPMLPNVSMAGPSQLHHHHAPKGSQLGADDVSGTSQRLS